MRVPKEFELKLRHDIQQLEGEKKMRFLMSIEREAMDRAIVQTRREPVLEVLETRFHGTPLEITTRIQDIEDPAALKDLLIKASAAQSLEEFQQGFAT